jgi:uncharacterized membrane protein YbaN (DUF454 family)
MVLRRIKKGILIFLGFLFVGIGILGIFLPLLPTTVFFLLSAYCFSKSSDKFYHWLLHNRWFGSYIKNYREKKGISIRVKIVSISVLWLTILYSAFFFVSNIYVRILLLLIAVGVTIHLVSIKTYKKEFDSTDGNNENAAHKNATKTQRH